MEETQMMLTLNDGMEYAALMGARESLSQAIAELRIATGYGNGATHTEAYAIGDIELHLRRKVANILRANGERVTKWALALEKEQESMRSTAFADKCSACGTYLATEADFAEHFVIADVRYLNLGTCDATHFEIANETAGHCDDASCGECGH